MLATCVLLEFSVLHISDLLYRTLGNVTGAIVNVDEFKVHENQDGSVDKTRTDLYLHFVDRRDHSIMEVTKVLNLVDQNIERLDKLFKVWHKFFVNF
jgi:carbonic anhydrase